MTLGKTRVYLRSRFGPDFIEHVSRPLSGNIEPDLLSRQRIEISGCEVGFLNLEYGHAVQASSAIEVDLCEFEMGEAAGRHEPETQARVVLHTSLSDELTTLARPMTEAGRAEARQWSSNPTPDEDWLSIAPRLQATIERADVYKARAAIVQVRGWGASTHEDSIAECVASMLERRVSSWLAAQTPQSLGVSLITALQRDGLAAQVEGRAKALWLLEQGALPDVAGSGGYRAVHMAAIRADVGFLTTLAQRGVDLRAPREAPVSASPESLVFAPLSAWHLALHNYKAKRQAPGAIDALHRLGGAPAMTEAFSRFDALGVYQALTKYKYNGTLDLTGLMLKECLAAIKQSSEPSMYHQLLARVLYDAVDIADLESIEACIASDADPRLPVDLAWARGRTCLELARKRLEERPDSERLSRIVPLLGATAARRDLRSIAARARSQRVAAPLPA
jgi:hypothetical protein